MADYWKSQTRKYCDFCKCWIADNKPSIDFHESGKNHKENVSKRLKDIHKNSAKEAKVKKKFENDMEKIEKAAMAAYLKDVECNLKDISAEQIIHEKRDGTEDIIHRVADVDPLDPFAKQKIARIEARESKANEKKRKKSESEDEKNKKSQEYSGSRLPIERNWYEARTQGYSYYWNIKTSESVWDQPAEGFVSLVEQEEKAKEQALQLEFLQQIEKEQNQNKAELMEEQRANTERLKLKEIRKEYIQRECEKSGNEVRFSVEQSSKQQSYKKDYNDLGKSKPYGSWQVIKKSEAPQINLQLPSVTVVSSSSFKTPSVQKVFKEKIVTRISTEESDDEGPTVSFKRRKLGNKNVRRRMEND